MEHIGKLLVRPEGDTSAPTPNLELLVRLPSTDELRARAEQAEQTMIAYQAECRERGFIDGGRMNSAKRDLSSAQQNLKDGLVRDELTKERPGGCWCLGLGGKERRALSREISSFEVYCQCPDGVQAREIAGAERQRILAERGRQFQRRLLAEARIPKRFQDCTFESYPASDATREQARQVAYWWIGPDHPDSLPVEQQDALTVAEWDALTEAYDRDLNVWQARKGSIFLYGPYGTGKTGLAVALVKEIVQCEERCLFVTVPSLLDQIRASYDRSGQESATDEDAPLKLADVKSVPYLVLDDLGAERVTDWVAERLFALINHRHDEELATIFTSNLSPEKLAKHIGERTTWRIVEMSEIINLDGPNLRERS